MDFKELAMEICSPVLDMVQRLDPDGWEKWVQSVEDRLRKEFGNYDRTEKM